MISPLLAGLVIGLAVYFGVRWLQSNESAGGGGRPSVSAGVVGLDSLKGRWMREDGYVIEVKAVDASGKIEAAYFNPRSIHVARALASRNGQAIGLFMELRDEGYPGCTYTLTYDSSRDELGGEYYQAAMNETFPVRFSRMK